MMTWTNKMKYKFDPTYWLAGVRLATRKTHLQRNKHVETMIMIIQPRDFNEKNDNKKVVDYVESDIKSDTQSEITATMVQIVKMAATTITSIQIS